MKHDKSATWKKCNMKIVQHEQSETRKICCMEKAQREKTAIWKKCNIKEWNTGENTEE